MTPNASWKAPNNTRRQWRAAREGSDFEWVVPHTLRKTVGTRVDREAGAAEAQAQLSHPRGSSVTEEHYLERVVKGPDGRAVLEQLAPPTPPG